MHRYYSYLLKPNKQHLEILKQFGGARRFLWNRMLNYNDIHYKETGKFLWYNDMIDNLPNLKIENPWLNDIPSQAIQQVLKDLDQALRVFCKNKDIGFPKYKKKYDNNDNIRIPQMNGHIKPNKAGLKIPKIKEPIKWIKHRPLDGLLKSITLKQDGDKWYCSCLCDLPNKEPILECNIDDILGIDLGIKDFAVTSDGEVIESCRYYRNNQKKLKRKQRQLSKARKSSNRRKNKVLKVRVIHKKIANQRKDFHHKLSNSIANDYKFVGLEDLNIKGMMQNHNLAKAIQDQGWSSFANMLAYKTNVIWVDRWYPSTKTCCKCGDKKNMTLDIRTYVCASCGNIMDRDLNASFNIRQWVINELHRTGAVQIYGQGDNELSLSMNCQKFPIFDREARSFRAE